MPESRHIMKVICPYQLAVGVKVCFMKSCHSNTCGSQAIQIFAYVHNTNWQNYTKYFLCLHFKESRLQCFKQSHLQNFVFLPFIPSFTHTCILPSFVPSFHPHLFPSSLSSFFIAYFFLYFLHSSINPWLTIFWS